MDHMAEAIKLAKKADPFPNPKVGAVLVKEIKTRDGGRETVVIGAGYHKAPGDAHAEIEAMEDARKKGESPEGATLYVTLEPCSHNMKRTPPCTESIISCGIKKVVYGMKDPNPLVSGAETLKAAGVKTEGPTMQKKAESINRRYISNIEKKPFVAIKVAMSIDGKTATSMGDSKWISGKRSRDAVHNMRTEYDAVMVGAGTVIADDPELTSHGKGRDPYRIIVDGKLRTPTNYRIAKKRDGKTIIVACEGAGSRRVKLLSRNAQVFLTGKDKVDLKKLVQALGAMGMKRILIEGGSGLNAEALKAGIVDKLYIFMAPKIIGGDDSKGLFAGEGVKRVKDAIKTGKMKTMRSGEDLLIECDLSR